MACQRWACSTPPLDPTHPRVALPLPPTHPPALPGVLSRAEWIKFYGLFFNKDRQASEVFNGIQVRV